MNLSKIGEVMGTFAATTSGKIVIGACMLLLLLGAALLRDNKKNNRSLDVKVIAFSAIAIALSFILSNFHLFKMPYGGSVTPFSMLFVIMIGYYFGAKSGFLAGCALGLLNMIVDPYIIHPIQMLLDYPLAFGMLGLGTMFVKKAGYKLPFACIWGVLGRFLCSFLSGVIFFGAYAPEGYTAITWSLIYNATYMFAECLLTVILLYIPAVKKGVQQIGSMMGKQVQ